MSEKQTYSAAADLIAKIGDLTPSPWWEPLGTGFSTWESKLVAMYHYRVADGQFARTEMVSQAPQELHLALERRGWSLRVGRPIRGWQVLKRTRPLPIWDRWLLYIPQDWLQRLVARFLVDPDYASKGWGTKPQRRRTGC